MPLSRWQSSPVIIEISHPGPLSHSGIHAAFPIAITTGVDLRDAILSEECQSQKIACHVNLFYIPEITNH